MIFPKNAIRRGKIHGLKSRQRSGKLESTSAAKADLKSQAVIAAVNRCATQNPLVSVFVFGVGAAPFDFAQGRLFGAAVQAPTPAPSATEVLAEARGLKFDVPGLKPEV
jgi:hypothetical protein